MGTILGEKQEVEKPPDDLDSEEKLVSEDILSNSAVPVNSDFNEALESKTHEFVGEVTASLQAEQDTQAATCSDWEVEVREGFDNDIASSRTGSNLENWEAESADHVTDLATVEEINGVENELVELEHYKVYSTFKTSNMDRRGQRGLQEKDIKTAYLHAP
ncbi:hypothetical protein ABG067_006994 [Albugo candida]